MTLSTLILVFALVASALTFILYKWVNKPNSWAMSWLQNFCGVWFIFSGFVKAVDPMGTAFKMEQYFAAFQQTFEPTWAKFIAPIFPFMANYAVSFSIAMVILEIVLGVALIIGFVPKWTSRIFFGLLIFFTILTGFTYLTGYVPSNKNFFDFTAWGSYDNNQMRVSDCGCFGDFLKLDPKVSFFKDLFLLLPGLIFLIYAKSREVLWTGGIRNKIMVGSLVASTLFCFYNTFLNEPIFDFRAFKNGADIANIRKAELEAAQQLQIETADIKNKTTGEVVHIPYATYMKEFKKYPKETWEAKFNYGEPKVAKTKVSDFQIMDTKGADVTLDILNTKGYSLMINAYKVHGRDISEQILRKDSLFIDSIWMVKKDTMHKKVHVGFENKPIMMDKFIPDADEVAIFTNKINPLVNSMSREGLITYAVISGLGVNQIKDLSKSIAAEYPILQADDILLKTIMRSNPGLILWKDGTIVEKWHHKHLPTLEELKAKMK